MPLGVSFLLFEALCYPQAKTQGRG